MLVQNQGSGKRSATVRTAAAAVDPSREPIRYKFDRTVTTATDLWNEWSLGHGPGP